MVGSKLVRWLQFAVFVLPALALYALFFLNPFTQGIRISFTNWDGRTSRTPISMPRAEFESQILTRVERPADRDYLLRIYHLDPADDQYKRYELIGLPRARVGRILTSIGWWPETYRPVGLGNFAAIFGGGVDERFYPRTIRQSYYSETSSLPGSIPRGDFEGIILPGLPEEARQLALRFYTPDGDTWRLNAEYDEFDLEDRIWLLPEVDVERTVSSTSVDGLIEAIARAGLAVDAAALDTVVRTFLTENVLSDHSVQEVREASAALYDLGAIRKLLAERWVKNTFDLGVVGFTLFFMVFTVIFSNLLAFALAMALDTKIRSRNVLRSVFFLPNVLSMIVVSLIWSFVFYNLLPAVTGIELWMGDPAKAPWLIVLVQVWQQSGYLMVIYLAGLQNIPVDVTEAAMIDGARFRHRLRFIILPLLMPALTICLFLSLSNSLKSFDLVYAMVGPSGYATGTVPIVMDIFFDAFAKRQAGLATAKAMLLFVVIATATSIQLAVMKRREVKL